jgi:hypothetical protein
VNTGGTVSKGGNVSTGGTVSTGGVGNTGGVTSSGGATGVGGTSGGFSATGGASTGGLKSTGGVGGGGANSAGASGGGAKSTGGNAATGGAGTGGSSGSGGSGGATTAKFSFFVTSYAALTKLSGSNDGFGGDLRFGETGDGAGLRGADKLCSQIAETAMPGAGSKQWRAFLSAGGKGQTTVHAIDRIGNGPWYDRRGRLFSASKANLMGFRPKDSDAAIRNDFPNENGTNNHNPDGRGQVDNHDTLTGSGADGKLYAGTSNPTCDGWTNKTGSAGEPRVGHAWPRTPSSDNTCSGSGFPGGGGGGDPATEGCYGHWMSSLDEAGCAPGASLIEMGPPDPSNPTVGSGGGYGAFYCFALTP